MQKLHSAAEYAAEDKRLGEEYQQRMALWNSLRTKTAKEAAGMKMAVLSTLISVFVIFFHISVANFDLGNLPGLSLLMVVITLMNIFLYKKNISNLLK